MLSNEYPPSDLTKEKNLWQIYLASRRIPSTIFNRFFLIISAILISLDIFLSDLKLDYILSEIKQWASLGFQAGLTTLGFLIAGFTIFATISKPSLSIAMAQIENKKFGISHLKKNYFVFMRVFIYYIVFCFFCLFLLFFAKKDGVLFLFLELFPSSNSLKDVGFRLTLVILLVFHVFILLQLKSFVFNTYHSVMTSLRWEAENGG
jgi:hypothetical protein